MIYFDWSLGSLASGIIMLAVLLVLGHLPRTWQEWLRLIIASIMIGIAVAIKEAQYLDDWIQRHLRR